MFDSGISQKDLIDEVIKEMDVAENIPYSKYEYWYNSLIQLLYSEIVKEGQSRTVTVNIENNQADIRLEDINAGDGTIEVPRFEDVTAVFVNGYELSRSTFISGTHLRNSYWSKGSDSITIWTDYGEDDTDVEIRFNVRPCIFTEGIVEKKGHVVLADIQNKYTEIKTFTDDEFSEYRNAVFNIGINGIGNSKIDSLTLEIYGTDGNSQSSEYTFYTLPVYTYKSEYDSDNKIQIVSFEAMNACMGRNDGTYNVLAGQERRYSYRWDTEQSQVIKTDNINCETYGFNDDNYTDGEGNVIYGVHNGYKGWLSEQDISLAVAYTFAAEQTEDERTVPLPYEFTELVRCKLRGEAYKLINDDALAAKWIGEYNTLLENFKVYISTHGSMYGRY